MRGIIVFALIGVGIACMVFQSLQSQFLNSLDAVRQFRTGGKWQNVQSAPSLSLPKVDEFGFDSLKFSGAAEEPHSKYV